MSSEDTKKELRRSKHRLSRSYKNIIDKKLV